MLKIVVDTNLWIRVLLGGKLTLPLLEAWQQGLFQVINSEMLLEELDVVWRRPRIQKRIKATNIALLAATCFLFVPMLLARLCRCSPFWRRMCRPR